MELLLFIVGFALGAWWTLRVVKKILFKRLLDGVEIIELPELTTEQVNESLFLYHNSSFICQGKTIEELARTFLEMKKIKIAMVQHEKQNIFFVDGEVLTSLEKV